MALISTNKQLMNYDMYHSEDRMTVDMHVTVSVKYNVQTQGAACEKDFGSFDPLNQILMGHSRSCLSSKASSPHPEMFWSQKRSKIVRIRAKSVYELPLYHIL